MISYSLLARVPAPTSVKDYLASNFGGEETATTVIFDHDDLEDKILGLDSIDYEPQWVKSILEETKGKAQVIEFV